MAWIFIIALAVAAPFAIWAGIAALMGIKEFYVGTSPWISIGEMGSVYVIPAAIILYRTLKKRNSPWAGAVLTAALVVFIPSVVAVVGDISMYPRVTFSEWREG